MKRISAALIAVLMMASLAACGDGDGEVQKPSSVLADSAQRSESGNDGSSQAAQPAEAEAAIEETVLVDEAGVKITAKDLSMDKLFGAELSLLIENNSGKDLTFQCQKASVNGYMIETMMSVDVIDGKKANEALTFMGSDLEACGISSFADMEFAFHIFTTAEWETYLDTAPIQLKTSAAETYEYAFDDSGDLAYEADGIKVVIKGLAQDDSIFGPSIVVYIENNTDKTFTVQSRDVSINGFMVDAMFSCDVMPGKKAVDTITFMSSQLEENEIAAIEDVELSFHIFDSDSWEGIVDTDAVSIHF